MRKWYTAFIFLSLAACNTIERMPVATVEPITSGSIIDMSYPIGATKYVSLHADRSLRFNRSCTQVLRLNLVQKKGYQDTVIELKNRAVLMGGNSVSLIGWRESRSKTILLGNIYMCKDKSFHIHPHPEN
jgi:hypothetical protein